MSEKGLTPEQAERLRKSGQEFMERMREGLEEDTSRYQQLLDEMRAMIEEGGDPELEKVEPDDLGQRPSHLIGFAFKGIDGAHDGPIGDRIYLTMEQLSQRPTRKIILDGRQTEARDIMTMSQEYAVGEMDQEAPPPSEMLRARRLEAARKLILEELQLTDFEMELIREGQRAATGMHLTLTDAGSLVVKMARALGLI